MTATEIAAWAAVLLVGVTLYGIRKDHDRQRVLETMKFYRNVMDSVEDYRSRILAVHGTSTISPEDAKKYRDAATERGGERDEVEMGIAIARYLNGLERLAVGANLGALDERILRRIGEGRFVTAHRQFQEYMEEAKSKRAGVFKEFREMAARWDLGESNRGGEGALGWRKLFRRQD